MADQPTTLVQEREPDTDAPADFIGQRPRLDFPVVAIGASAGGLQAFTDFLDALPDDPGMAFVVIQHLPPDKDSLLVELLARHTTLPVLETADGQEVEPNHIYATVPGYTLTMKDGRLHIGKSVREPGHREPIDMFFTSLAAEQQSRAVAIVLSGMGSNGTAGAQAIHAAGGLCIAQEPESAKFPSMPRSLIDRNLADFILRPGEIPGLLKKYAAHDYVLRPDPPDLKEARGRSAFKEVLNVIRTRSGHDFNGYKTPTLLRRIQRRMGLSQTEHLADYATRLRQNPTEVAALADDLLINVTGFFRDAEVWEALSTQVIAPLVKERSDGGTIRAWVTACSSGEEAYTLAMLLIEAAEAAGKQFDIKVFATDMAKTELAHARRGSFAAGIEADVTPERLDRFFVKTDDRFLVKKELREIIVFAPQNVLSDPPFSTLDICTCRNLLIYLEPDVQQRLLGLLHFGLREGGALLLGNSETIGVEDDLFQPINQKARLFRRVGPTRHGLVEFNSRPRRGNGNNAPGVPRPTPSKPHASLAQVAQQVLLAGHTPAAVVVDRQGHIAYFHGPTERYLTPPRGEPTRDVLKLARDTLRSGIRATLLQVVSTNAPVSHTDGLFEVDGKRRRSKIDAAPLTQGGHKGYYLLTFTDTPEPVSVPTASPNGESAQQTRFDDGGRAPEHRRGTAVQQRGVESLERRGHQHQ